VISAAIERCAGVDVGKKFLAVCILVGPLEGEPRMEKRRYGTTMAELEELREWLRSEGITQCGDGEHRIVLESGGRASSPVPPASRAFCCNAGVPVSDVQDLLCDDEKNNEWHYSRWVPERQARLNQSLSRTLQRLFCAVALFGG